MKGNVRAGTKPELRLRQLLREAGFPGYRLHWRKAPGTPDVAYPGRKLAIFVNGCFWHRCPHCSPASPRSHGDFWERKFARNQERDARKAAELTTAGWRVVTVWECQLREHADDVMTELTNALLADRRSARGSLAPTLAGLAGRPNEGSDEASEDPEGT